MRKYLLSITGIATLVLLLSQATIAQEKNEKKKTGDNDEIIIRRKTDKDTKVTIEIKGDEVLVNGKPVDDYEGDDVSVRKQHRGTVIYSSPFRNQTFNGDIYTYSSKSIAFLGVVTEKSAKGARIESVTNNSAAEKAGLKEGDVIIKIDDMTTEDADDVSKAIRKHKPEEKANLVYLRDGKENKVSVTLGKRKETNNLYSFNPPDLNLVSPRIGTPNFNFDWKDGGGMGQSFAFGGRARLGIKAQDTEDEKGVKVLEVDEESIAEKAGIKEGDIITDFDGKSVNSAEDLAKAATAAREKNAFSVKITRNGTPQTIEVKIPKKLKTTNL